MRESSDRYKSRMQCRNGGTECASDMKCEQGKIDSEDGHENETVRNGKVAV
jgi:hypothetical protein